MTWEVVTNNQYWTRTSVDEPSNDAIQAALSGVNATSLMAAARGLHAVPSGTAGDQSQTVIGAPSEIHNLQDVTAEQWGAWVGPARVTRANEQTGAFHVYVTGVWQFPWDNRAGVPPPPNVHPGAMTAMISIMTDHVLHAVSEDFDHFPGTIVEYSAALNGPLEWWRSGQAAATRTRNNADSSLSTIHAENPHGPDAGALPQTLVDSANDAENRALLPALGGLGGLFVKGAIFVGVVAAAYVGVSAYRAYAADDGSDEKPAPKPRKRVAAKAESDDEEAPAPRYVSPPSPRKSPNDLFDEAKAANR